MKYTAATLMHYNDEEILEDCLVIVRNERLLVLNDHREMESTRVTDVWSPEPRFWMFRTRSGSTYEFFV